MDWVKIMCTLLDHRKIKMIRKGPEGNTLVLLWLLMLIEAGKCNRGGYLMISDCLPYTPETLGMVTDIPLPTVQLGLSVFAGLGMIDHQDDAIYVKNWGKYQSEDKLQARREKERIRQQRHRQNERDKLHALPAPGQASRDGHSPMSRDVTLENREEQNRGDKTTTDDVLLLLSGTPFLKITKQEFLGLEKRHGIEKLALAADVAAETWRRDRQDRHNPGGYLQSICSSLVLPEWYVSFPERRALIEAQQRRKAEMEADQAAQKALEDAQIAACDALWESLSEEQREEYRKLAIADLPSEFLTETGVTAMAKLLARDAAQPALSQRKVDQ